MKNSNFYVDELPKSCESCPFYKLETYVDVFGSVINSHECVLDGSMITGDCPLKQLMAHNKLKDLDYEILKRDYDFLRKEYNRLIDVGNSLLAEERKRVVQELKKMMPIFFGKKGFDWEGFNDYLDQIERGE